MSSMTTASDIAGPGSADADTAALSLVERWRAVAAATGPADREAAEEGVRLAYDAAGIARPERIVWVDSP
ncbi:hypothetical protein AB4212_51260, partial [Streptomyces sp. 2MCAF27]